MTVQIRSTFTSVSRLEEAQLVTEQGYAIKAAATAMNVGKSTLLNIDPY